ncbi:MAG: preprotein translocase subunit SecE [Dysosmobacter sp.]|nr:preprotein translocase subunit SecE [Dysosmobacter sp.]
MAEEAKKKKDRGLWFREMKSELKKVVWPNKETVAKNTGTVLLCSLLIGACIWVFDFVAVSAVDLILHVFGA